MFLLVFAESIQLFPDGTLFIHIALILVMIWVLNRTFFRPINRVIASREKFRGGRNVEAEEILSIASEKQNLYAAEMLKARAQGGDLVERKRTEAAAARASMVTAAKAETAQSFETDRAALASQAEAARTAIAAEAEVMADKISAAILK